MAFSFDFFIKNNTKQKIYPSFIKSIAEKLARHFHLSQVDISIVAVGETTIAKLNRSYRKKDKATDVLSFCYEYNSRAGLLSGEIIICPLVIIKNARDFKNTYKKELQKIIVHSFVHLLGYDHESENDFEKMDRVERDCLKLFKDR